MLMCCMYDTERNTNGFNDIKHIPLNNILAVGRNTYFEISIFKYNMKLEMCPQYTDAPAVGYLTIKLQNSTWYKCLNLSLTESRTYVCTHIRTDRHTFVRTYPRMENRKTICPRYHPLRGIKIILAFSVKIHKFNINFLLFDSISSFSFIIFGLFQKYRFMYCFLRSLYKTHSNKK